MEKKIDYQQVLDSYGIKYRKGLPEEVDASIRNMDMIFESVFCGTLSNNKVLTKRKV